MKALYRNDKILLIGDTAQKAMFSEAECKIRTHYAPELILNPAKMNLPMEELTQVLINSLRNVSAVYVIRKSGKTPLVKTILRQIVNDHQAVKVFYDRSFQRNPNRSQWRETDGVSCQLDFKGEPATKEESIRKNTFVCISCGKRHIGDKIRSFCPACRDAMNAEDSSGEKLAALWNKAHPIRKAERPDAVRMMLKGA